MGYGRDRTPPPGSVVVKTSNGTIVVTPEQFAANAPHRAALDVLGNAESAVDAVVSRLGSGPEARLLTRSQGQKLVAGALQHLGFPVDQRHGVGLLGSLERDARAGGRRTEAMPVGSLLIGHVTPTGHHIRSPARRTLCSRVGRPSATGLSWVSWVSEQGLAAVRLVCRPAGVWAGLARWRGCNPGLAAAAGVSLVPIRCHRWAALALC